MLYNFNKVIKLNYSNRIELEIRGDYALFSEPVVSAGGEKLSYPVPTYGALCGMLRAVYWKPTIIWIPEKLRVMNRIRTDTISVRRLNYCGGNDLSCWTVLRDVRWQLCARFVWNENRPELAPDRCEHRHFHAAKRMLSRGGALPVFLGSRRFPAEVSPCVFGEGEGEYDSCGTQDFGFMYHSLTYPDEGWDSNSRSNVTASYWRCVMNNGIIEFPLPEECVYHKTVEKAEIKRFGGQSLELV